MNRAAQTFEAPRGLKPAARFWDGIAHGCLMLPGSALMVAAVFGGCRHGGMRPGPGGRADRPIQAVWVTRWDYESPGDVARVMNNCRAAGFNTVLFQVRGNGTALYRSRLEPWADELGGRDPGFDPLKVACKEAHRRGLSLHAWFNVIPGWRGSEPPANRRQLYWARPDWFWRDAAGRREPLGWYNNLNPCYPEVRHYLVDVMREVVAGYPVDGLHLDYIRFPNERNKGYPLGVSVPDYPRDRRTLALFQKETGATPESSPRRWDQWRTDQITRLVTDARVMVNKVNPRVQLSAAVGACPEEAKRKHFQDSRQWIALGLLDAVYPMNYAPDLRSYVERLVKWSAMRLPIPVVTGVMFDKRDGATVVEQVARARRTTAHFAAFAYNSLFERLDSRGRPIYDRQSASRAALRKSVIPYLRRLASSRV